MAYSFFSLFLSLFTFRTNIITQQPHNMEESPEQLMSQALLEKLEPLIHTIESQLRDLGYDECVRTLARHNCACLSQKCNSWTTS